jgi:protein gp37
MATNSKIEWTETTWNPVTGCIKISQGCKFCYADRLAKRLKAMGNPRYKNGFELTLHEDLITLPLKWKQPRVIFVNSMSDLFQDGVPFKFIENVFKTMEETPQHIYQILTKRGSRVKELSQDLTWPFNVWMGVSVEDERVLDRIDDLVQVPAKTRFLSCEPLIGPLDSLQLDGIHWVIVGGESGPGARPMNPKWVHSILKQCRNSEVPFFFKQWGGVQKHRTGRELDGRKFDEMPVSFHNRQEELFIK